MFNLETTPYVLDDQAALDLRARLDRIEDRVRSLRQAGTLSEGTLRDYYGEKRFEQVAESNALEGSTLSAGETELAVLKGITITGHDPAFIKDAVTLDRALHRITELAREREAATDLAQLQEIHGILLEGRPGAGIFRRERVTIRGAKHVPPRTWEEIMRQMERWQEWSRSHRALPAPLRSVLLHAWLTHVHPFIDGNGRTARAIGNLELIRAGYPPIIIKKKDRHRYLGCLAESDEGGDIRSFVALVFERLDGALTGLERSAGKRDDTASQSALARQIKLLGIWNTGVQLLAATIENDLGIALDAVGGKCEVHWHGAFDLDDYLDLRAGKEGTGSEAFTVTIEVPGRARLEKRAFTGARTAPMLRYFGQEGGPALFWSSKNPSGFPSWKPDGAASPYAIESTAHAGNGDRWTVLLADGSIHDLSTTDLARQISRAIVEVVAAGS